MRIGRCGPRAALSSGHLCVCFFFFYYFHHRFGEKHLPVCAEAYNIYTPNVCVRSESEYLGLSESQFGTVVGFTKCKLYTEICWNALKTNAYLYILLYIHIIFWVTRCGLLRSILYIICHLVAQKSRKYKIQLHRYSAICDVCNRRNKTAFIHKSIYKERTFFITGHRDGQMDCAIVIIINFRQVNMAQNKLIFKELKIK